MTLWLSLDIVLKEIVLFCTEVRSWANCVALEFVLRL